MNSMSKIEYKLRKFRKSDAGSIAKYANNINIAKWLTNEFPHPYSKEDAENFIEMVSKGDYGAVFTIEINGEASGSIAVIPISDDKTDKNNYNNYNNKNKNKDKDKENTDNSQIQDTQINICNKQAELGYWLAEKYWNRGIMSQAIKETVDYGFETFNIDCIYATPFVKNLASQKVLKKVGFASDTKMRRIIKNNETYEVFIFSIKRDCK